MSTAENTQNNQSAMHQSNPGESGLRGTVGTIFGDGRIQRALHWKRAWAMRLYPIVMLAIDLVALFVLFLVAMELRQAASVEVLGLFSRRVLGVIAAVSVVSVYLVGGYNYQVNKASLRFVSEHLIVSIGAFIAVMAVVFAFVGYGGHVHTSRATIMMTLVAFPASSILYRAVLSKLKLALQRGNAYCIIGSGAQAEDLYRRMRQHETGHEVFVVDSGDERVGRRLIEGDPHSPEVAGLDLVKFNSSIRGKYVEAFVLASPIDEYPADFSRSLVSAHFNGARVFTYDTFLSQKLMMIPPSELSMQWALSEGFRLSRSITYDRVKRLSDIALSLFGLVMASPIMLVTAIAVKLTSPGPIIFKQTRVGKQEQPFELYKFRSMKVGSEKGAKYTAKGDSRITAVGGFLRKSRLDELPQLWNVLKGDLSLIGPRPEWVELVKGYEQRFPYYHFRHIVKPGITGWAQVNYSYGASDEDTVEKLYYDLYYVRRYSPVLDMTIVIKTLYMMLFGRGQ
ncbi:sugar transferase [Sulfuriroseicoccus oceanibius]|uniref:Sugar transferase n=1 Tax=Sulfuriroseicoccus oceanibius TaxID=2707525 RepID=A0A6B3L0S9_9BACT|nr:sugar transferase [Sulfuriroseicoccus oceanibius]QQL44298.1 sugar transferase [Sulfuriroseicoccus oceanibius]